MLAELQRSAFLDDLTPADRRVGRILLTLPIGVIAALLAALIGGVVVFVAFAIAGGGADAAERLMTMVGQAAVPVGLTATAFVLCLLAFANGGMALAFTGIAALLHHRKLGSYFTAAPRFRWRLLLLGLGLFFAVLGPLLLASAALDPKAPGAPILAVSQGLGGRLAYLVIVVALLLVAAAAEELVFRGWLLKVTGAFVRDPRVVLLLSGVLFSAIHFDPNLDAFLMRLAMGMGLAWMTLRLGGTEFAIGAHAANNILILLFIQPMSLKPDAAHAFPPETLVIAPLMLAGYVAMAEIVARWAPLRRWGRVAVA
ncbi:CAAX amino terminal protease family [Caulobacter sp. AP07]|uniref:CPBP family intramembrane glutamic endopeptidase n=1 Tax=Caulobacter sp. AP07 TaxID=1144304 RepID=UPI000271DE9F|nr:CPBP family intramembrane glutamic endopeptidase [Caulobacter sp. AP07]EJL34324.1 CAAX amino terminal protease family [Caulobacter sp. AP07]